jgi:hypothetical protein
MLPAVHTGIPLCAGSRSERQHPAGRHSSSQGRNPLPHGEQVLSCVWALTAAGKGRAGPAGPPVLRHSRLRHSLFALASPGAPCPGMRRPDSFGYRPCRAVQDLAQPSRPLAGKAGPGVRGTRQKRPSPQARATPSYVTAVAARTTTPSRIPARLDAGSTLLRCHTMWSESASPVRAGPSCRATRTQRVKARYT